VTATTVVGVGRIPLPEGEAPMSDALDWNAKTIAEFRANEGRVGAP
jgi:hypothetical protein